MARGTTGQIVPAGTATQTDALQWYKTINTFYSRFIGSRNNPGAPAKCTWSTTHRSGGNDDQVVITHLESGISSETLVDMGLLKFHPKRDNIMQVIAILAEYLTENYTPNTEAAAEGGIAAAVAKAKAAAK